MRTTGKKNILLRPMFFAMRSDAIRHFCAPMAAFTQRLQHLCEWSELDEMANRLRRMAFMPQAWSPTDLISPFAFICLPNGTTSSEQFQVAKKWGEQFQRPAAPYFQQFAERHNESQHFPRPKKRIRLGYLSADFYNHATAWLLTEMLEHHDREHFEVYGYSIVAWTKVTSACDA